MTADIRIHLAFCLLFSLLFNQGLQANEEDASWSANFLVEPSQTELFGYTASEINNDFQLIEAISCQQQDINPIQCQQVADSGGAFELLVDQNHDGQLEVWSIAIAKLVSGSYAKVLIIRDEQSGALLQSFLVDSHEAFSALYFYQGRILWGMCLHCDVMADVSWQTDMFQLSWQQELHQVIEIDFISSYKHH
jgi:hypothetical protein